MITESLRVRPAIAEDVGALLELASKAGKGLSNLPPDLKTLAAQVEQSSAQFATDIKAPDDERYIFVLEDVESGEVIGTSSIFSAVGKIYGFYSYKLGKLIHTSSGLNQRAEFDVLHLANDFTGESEVGGLFLDPDARRGGAGRLIAQARYLFIAAFRKRFSEKMVAELRGWLNEAGESPFWNALGARFFGVNFEDADLHYAIHGSRFIADLQPKHPIYVQLLPEAAQAAIGRPHDDSVPAYNMLLKEGYRYDGYVDVFDAGPTLSAFTDDLHTVRGTCAGVVASNSAETGALALLCAGGAQDFRACYGYAVETGDGIAISEKTKQLLKVGAGDAVWWRILDQGISSA